MTHRPTSIYLGVCYNQSYDRVLVKHSTINNGKQHSYKQGEIDGLIYAVCDNCLCSIPIVIFPEDVMMWTNKDGMQLSSLVLYLNKDSGACIQCTDSRKPCTIEAEEIDSVSNHDLLFLRLHLHNNVIILFLRWNILFPVQFTSLFPPYSLSSPHTLSFFLMPFFKFVIAFCLSVVIQILTCL